MYLNFYGLHKEPFNLTPDPEFFFLGAENQQALASLIYGIEKRKGCVVITGQVGVGKTTMVRSYLEESRDSALKVVYVFNSNLSFLALVKIIYQELGLAVESDDLSELVNGLHLALIEAYQQGINVALIVDGAQNMPVETLENLRMLSNLETVKDKLIQIILIGQPELTEILDRDELRAFKQRIFIRLAIGPFGFEESNAYIKHRLTKAGGTETPIFKRKALHRIIEEAEGIPRILNILCDNALITGFGYRKKPVDIGVALEIIKDFRGREAAKFKRPSRTPLLGYGLALAVLLLAGGLFFLRGNLPFFGQKNNHTGQSVVAVIPASPALPAPSPTVPMPLTNPTVLKEPKTNARPEASPPPKKVPEVRTGAKGPGGMVQQVEKGDTLTSLIEKRYSPEEMRQYGRSRLINLIREKNPGLKDLDRIVAGKTIVLPELNEESGKGP
jgi:general secretion pathway protein A